MSKTTTDLPNDNVHQHRDDPHAGIKLDWEKMAPAGTTQRIKHGDVPSIEITLRQVEALVEVFGGHDAEVSIIQRPDAWPHLDLGLYAYFTEYPGEGTFYLGPTDVDDDLAANGRAAAAPIRTWRERIGQVPGFPLHAPTDVERAMEAEIAELRAQVGRPAAGQEQEKATAEILDMLGRIHPLVISGKHERNQWFERLRRTCAIQQPVPVPDQAAVVWRWDLLRATNELLQLRALHAFNVAQRARKDKLKPVNGIAATMMHDEGAIACCSYCGRYSLDPATLSSSDSKQPVCACGKQHGWSGSFKLPDANSRWSGKAPGQQDQGSANQGSAA